MAVACSAKMKAVALTIAGSDPSGGAGIQADLKTFHQFGVYGEAVVTLLTVQNTVACERVECVPAELVVQLMVAEVPVILVMDGPCVICTAFSLAWSIGFCANMGAASISDSPNNVIVRFIRFSH